MNRSLCFVVAVLVTFVLTVPATAGYIEYQGKLIDGHLEPTLDLFVTKDVSDHFGWSAFFLACEGWSEGLVGPTISPVSWFQAGVSMGVESHHRVTRFGSFAWAGAGSSSIVYIHEEGGSGGWTKSVGKYNVAGGASDQLSVGFHYQTGFGLGPHLEMGPKPITGWFTWFPKGDGAKAILGIQLAF